MAKQRPRKVLSPRRLARATDDDDLLIRYAESLGRAIGSLERQLRSVMALVKKNRTSSPRKPGRQR